MTRETTGKKKCQSLNPVLFLSQASKYLMHTEENVNGETNSPCNVILSGLLLTKLLMKREHI